ncbi:hypothetical protein D3C81_1328090 [compost metagenome]
MINHLFGTLSAAVGHNTDMQKRLAIDKRRRRQGVNGMNQLRGNAVRLFQRAMRQQNGEIAVEIARQQRRRVAHHEGRQQIDQRIHQFLHRTVAVGFPQRVEIR